MKSITEEWSNMKVCLDLNTTLNKKSGVGWYTYNLIRTMSALCEKKSFLDIQLQGLVMDIAGRRMGNSDIVELGKNLPIKASPFISYGLLEHLWNINLVNYQSFFRGQEGDIYHFFNFTLPPKIRGKKVITIYDMVYYKYPETMKSSNLSRLKKEISRSIQETDVVITISEAIKKEICEIHGIREEKVRIIYPGIFHEEYEYSYTELQINNFKIKHNFTNDYLLYLGTLEPRKNIETLIKAFALLKSKESMKQIKLVLAGAKGWNYESIYSKVREYSLAQDVIFLGYVDERDKHLLYKLSKGFVFPSIYEGFGMPVLEAMAAGVPVITSKAEALQEVVGEAGICVEAKDYEALCANMELIISDEILRERMITLGRQRSLNFSWEKSAKKMLEIYASMGA